MRSLAAMPEGLGAFADSMFTQMARYVGIEVMVLPAVTAWVSVSIHSIQTSMLLPLHFSLRRSVSDWWFGCAGAAQPGNCGAGRPAGCYSRCWHCLCIPGDLDNITKTHNQNRLHEILCVALADVPAT
jgi:hypothetical protein